DAKPVLCCGVDSLHGIAALTNRPIRLSLCPLGHCLRPGSRPAWIRGRARTRSIPGCQEEVFAMPRFLVTYHGVGEPAPEQAQQAMAAFMAWASSVGGALVGPGAPLGPGQTVRA